MSTNEERREAARRKLEERLEREKQAAKKRRLALIGAAGVVVVAVAAVGGFFWYKAWDDGRHTVCEYADAPVDFKATIDQLKERVATLPDDQKADGEAFLKTIEDGAGKQRTSPKPESRVRNSGTVDLDLTTSLGQVPIVLDRSEAACNVNAVATLANAGFYDDTSCHRLTMSENLSILQCGDPTSTGMGGPGWTSPDELPTGLKEVPLDPQMAQFGMPQTVIYPRGTIAIANSNNDQQGRSNTGSAQFFIVTKDSTLQPNLSVVGKVSDEGMKVIDEVAEGGIAPVAGGTAEDGAPKTPLVIESASAHDAA